MSPVFLATTLLTSSLPTAQAVEQDRAHEPLERFSTKWTPVRRQEARQDKGLGPHPIARRSDAALAGRPTQYAHLRPSPNAAKSYAIEFRARYALSYGHAFVMFGPLNASGDFAQRTVAGLHPAGDDPTPWMIGHVLPVPSETGPSDGDLEDQYVSARYRVVLSGAEYNRVVQYIRMRQASNPRWHVLFNNCIQFVSDIGRYMGLVIPSSAGAYPKEFITQLRQLNEGNSRSTAQSRAENHEQY